MMKYIPGYRGYVEKETRREADRALREALMAKLRGGKEKVQDVREMMAESGQLEGIDDVDRLDLLFENVVDRLGFASYGYAGFFDAARVDEDALDLLYEYDESLATTADAIVSKAEELKQAASGGQDLKATIEALKGELRDLEGKLDNRQNAILGVA